MFTAFPPLPAHCCFRLLPSPFTNSLKVYLKPYPHTKGREESQTKHCQNGVFDVHLKCSPLALVQLVPLLISLSSPWDVWGFWFFFFLISLPLTMLSPLLQIFCPLLLTGNFNSSLKTSLKPLSRWSFMKPYLILLFHLPSHSLASWSSGQCKSSSSFMFM